MRKSGDRSGWGHGAHAGHGGPGDHEDREPQSAGHDAHEGHSPGMFRDRFWLSLLLTLPVVIWASHIEGLLTGDAQAVADELGIDRVFAEVLPDQKASKVRELQAQGRKVAMVGDGVNDATAPATADIGIAIGAGTAVAVEAGHIVLVRSDPRDIPRIITLSHATYRKMIQNLWWAAGYNILAIPLAAGILAAWGVLLTPAVGAVLMSASTVIVAANAQLLRRVEL